MHNRDIDNVSLFENLFFAFQTIVPIDEPIANTTFLESFNEVLNAIIESMKDYLDTFYQDDNLNFYAKELGLFQPERYFIFNEERLMNLSLDEEDSDCAFKLY